jgi:hypothetical protein
MHAMKKNVPTTVCLLLEILLGVEDRAVIAFFKSKNGDLQS